MAKKTKNNAFATTSSGPSPRPLARRKRSDKGRTGVENAMLDIAPVTGEIRSANEFVNLAKNMPKPYVKGGQVIYPDTKADTAQMMLALAGAIPLAGMAARGAPKVLNKIIQATPTTPLRRQLGAIVYHGSPHKFDKFRMSSVGSGEGAQAYGHGLYMADARDVAKLYQSDLTFAGHGALEIPGLDPSVNRQIARDFYGSDFDSIDDIPPEWYDNIVDDLIDEGEYELADQLANADKTTARLSRGYLYQADLPDDSIAKMIDWDTPIGKQSPEVKAMARRVFAELDEDDIGYGLTYANRGNMDFPDSMLTNVDEWTGADLYNVMTYNAGAPGASQWANEYGIPGIKYADAVSRPQVVPYRQQLEAMSDTDLLAEAERVLGIDADDITLEDLDDWVIEELIEADDVTLASRGYATSRDNVTRNYVVFDENLPKIINTE